MRTHCRACNALLGHTILDLGTQPPSNMFRHEEYRGLLQFPLAVAQCTKCTLLQLTYDVDPSYIFHGEYPLHSSKGSAQWLRHVKRLCHQLEEGFGLSKGSQVIEIGSNDGYLLRNLSPSCRVLGIDPTGIPADVPTIKGYFNTELSYDLPMADVVIALNTVAQIPDLRDFFRALARVLKLSGVAILEFPNLVTTINETQFDTIYHEHYSYLSVQALQHILPSFGLGVYHVEKLETHGGSLRVYIGTGVAPHESVAAQVLEESALDLYAFEQRVKKIRSEFNHFMTTSEFVDAKVCAYGAAARGNTFLNYCRPYWCEYHKLPMIADINPEKIGKFAPGTSIPIVSEEDLIAAEPDYILLLCWTWKDEAVKRLRNRGYKGAFVTAIPQLEVFS